MQIVSSMINRVEKAGKLFPMVSGQAYHTFDMIKEQYYLYDPRYVEALDLAPKFHAEEEQSVRYG